MTGLPVTLKLRNYPFRTSLDNDDAPMKLGARSRLRGIPTGTFDVVTAPDQLDRGATRAPIFRSFGGSGTACCDWPSPVDVFGVRMWNWQLATPPWVLREIEITEEIPSIRLAPEEMGAYVLLRWRGRPLETLWLARAEHGGLISAAKLQGLIKQATDERITALALEAELIGERPPAPIPSLTIAVCTRNRPELLHRCLAALVAMRDRAMRDGAGRWPERRDRPPGCR